MSSLRKILVPFDNNKISLSALEYAAMFASGVGAEITALHLADSSKYASKSDYQAELSRLVDEQLRPQLKIMRSKFPDVKSFHLQTLGLQMPIHEHILEFQKQGKFDFVVLRSHGFGELTEWEQYLTSTNAYKVVLAADCPVFSFTTPPNNPKLKKILLPLDLSEGTLFKVPLAIELASRFQAEIHLLSISGSEEAEISQQLQEVEEWIRGKNIRIISYLGTNESLQREILDYSDKHEMDLVMVMSRPSSAWTELLLPPGIKKIMALSKVPVISIRSNTPVSIGL